MSDTIQHRIERLRSLACRGEVSKMDLDDILAVCDAAENTMANDQQKGNRLVRRSAWGAMWRSSNRLDGVTRHLLCENCVPKLFVTRADARQWIEEHYGYIRRRGDLKQEPHGWQMPVAVRVCITPNGKDEGR